MWATCPANRIFPSILLSYQYYMCCINQQFLVSCENKNSLCCLSFKNRLVKILCLGDENLVRRWRKSRVSVMKISCVGDENLVRRWWKSHVSVMKILCVGDENLILCVGDENLVRRWRKHVALLRNITCIYTTQGIRRVLVLLCFTNFFIYCQVQNTVTGKQHTYGHATTLAV